MKSNKTESELSKHKLKYETVRLNSKLIKEMDKVLKQYGLWNKIKRLWTKK